MWAKAVPPKGEGLKPESGKENMFTTIGNMTNACLGDPRLIYFPGQRCAEIADIVAGVIALVVGAIIFSQGYQLRGTCLIAFSIFQSHILFGNIVALIRLKRLNPP